MNAEFKKKPLSHVVGVISDTHGLVRPEALRALAGVELIIHAGDVGSPEVLEALERVAPVVAVRGNTDQRLWAVDLPPVEVVELGDVFLYVLHDLQQLDLDPVAAGLHAVISGHTHRPFVDRRGGVLYLNPGSAGPVRSELPVSLFLLHITAQSIEPERIDLVATIAADRMGTP